MATRFDDWEGDFLAHHGIRGQKWGVRRFQNEDGSLTSAGKEHYGIGRRIINKRYQRKDGELTKAGIAKIAKGNKWYLQTNPKDRKSRTKERDKVRDERNEKYWDAVAKGMDTSAPSKKDRQLWDGYKDKWAKAMLKDAKLNVTPKSKAQVKKILRSIDPEYNYNYLRKIDDGTIDTREMKNNYQKYKANRDKMIHYKRERIKRGAEMVKSLFETAHTAKKPIKR